MRLDTKRLLGFRLIRSEAHGQAMGAKIGTIKVEQVIGAKIGNGGKTMSMTTQASETR